MDGEGYDLKLDDHGLLNLHKALLEANFHTMPDNKLISASPLIANLYIQIRNATQVYRHALLTTGSGTESVALTLHDRFDRAIMINNLKSGPTTFQRLICIEDLRELTGLMFRTGI